MSLQRNDFLFKSWARYEKETSTQPSRSKQRDTIVCANRVVGVVTACINTETDIIYTVGNIQDGPKNWTILKAYNSFYDDAENIQFFIWSKNKILNITIFKYSLHKFREP